MYIVIYYNVRVPLISEIVSLSGRGEGLSPRSCLMDWKQCLLEELLWTKACDPLLLLVTPIWAIGSWVYCIVEAASRLFDSRL